MAGRHDTQNDFLKKARAVYGNEYDYSKSNYVNYRTKLEVRCNACQTAWQVSPKDHLGRRVGCPNCRGCAVLSINEFVRRSRLINDDKFDYSLVEYKNNKTKVCLICRSCVITFWQRPDCHLYSKHGCPRCSKPVYDTVSFINNARSVHGTSYGYDDVAYKASCEKVIIQCNKCTRAFTQTPANHLQGQGCPQCAGNITLTTEEFVKRANQVHGFMFDYAMTVYVGANVKVTIGCKSCSVNFSQTPSAHINMKHGCPRCASRKKSHGETLWLNCLGIDQKDRNKFLTINGRQFAVDALIERTVYEYYGSYWHGDPRRFSPVDVHPMIGVTYGELFEKTCRRQTDLEVAGYDVKFVWEIDRANGLMFSDAHPVP